MSTDPKAQLDSLLVQLADGDRAAFTVVFQILWQPVLRLCRSMLKNDADAADAAQQALEKVLTRCGDYDSKAASDAVGTRHRSLGMPNVCSPASRRRELAEEQAPELGAGSEDELAQRELMQAAVEALGELSPPDREALVATFWEEATNVTGATLRQTSRARAQTPARHIQKAVWTRLTLASSRRRARRKYEWARIRRAVLGFAPSLVVVLLAAMADQHPRSATAFGVAMFPRRSRLALVRSRHSARRFARPGDGLLPLALALCANHMGHACMGDHCMMLCVPACSLGGLGAGVGISIIGLRWKQSWPFWVGATTLNAPHRRHGLFVRWLQRVAGWASATASVCCRASCSDRLSHSR
jgi:RNA polymerase sigma-70 factor (ECF subfamily)